MSALTLTDAPLGADADALPHAARHAAPAGAVTGAPRVPRSLLPASSSAVSMWDFDEADPADLVRVRVGVRVRVRVRVRVGLVRV